MEYKYTHFIPQNTAPSGSKSIGVYDSVGKKVYSVPIGRLTPAKKEKLYSFGLVSDIHLVQYRPENTTKFDNALTFFERQGASFCCHCGDVTDLGFWYVISEVEGTSYFDPYGFEQYQTTCQKHNIPVYGCCGNHESYNGYNITGVYTDVHGVDPNLVVDNLAKLQEYTGHGLTYTITEGNDVFIFLGQPTYNEVMSDEDLQWLYETLEANRNRRCLVFVHSYIEEDSGDPLDLRENGIFEHWGKTKEAVFMKLLSHYKNTVLFHGHSHTKFCCQELDENANYTEKNGFRSVHIPSIGYPRDIVDNKTVNDYAASEGYLVDVYEDCIVLNGMDLINNECVPLGVYRVDTTLQTVEAGTFADSSGIIKT